MKNLDLQWIGRLRAAASSDQSKPRAIVEIAGPHGIFSRKEHLHREQRRFLDACRTVGATRSRRLYL
jgi:hypothetical protein